MKIYVIDLSIEQNSFFDFRRDFDNKYDLIYINGLKFPYPKLIENSLVIITGSEHSICENSPWLDSLTIWFLNIYEKHPVLAICFGHQLIAKALVGNNAVGKAEIPEMTFIPINFIKNHPIFNNIEKSFKVMSSHYDEVKIIPEGFDIYANSKDCKIQAMIHKTKPIFGLQFHPEFDLKKGKNIIETNIESLEKYNINYQYFLNKIPEKRSNTKIIFENFIHLYS